MVVKSYSAAEEGLGRGVEDARFGAAALLGARPGTGSGHCFILRVLTGADLILRVYKDPELFFAESPQDVEQAKAMCRGCRARLACLAGALERREPWGVWGGELLMSGAIVPHKRSRGRPRKDVVTIGANA